MDSHIKNLRKKLKLDCIVTVTGVGYKLRTSDEDIYKKPLLCTLALLTLFALLANGIIYTLMRTVYTKQKQQDLTVLRISWPSGLGREAEDIVSLMGSFRPPLRRPI